MSGSEAGGALGIHLAAGVAWLSGATTDENFAPDRTDRIVFQDQQLGSARALHEFEESLKELIERLNLDVIALLEAGQSQNPPSAQASRTRGWLEGAVMMAAHRTTTRLVRITHTQVKNELGVRPSQAEIRAVLRDKVHGEVPVRWDNRAPALAAAILALRGFGDAA
jgi:Holliday junction resolvasome RuvABC endonuclease subunit